MKATKGQVIEFPVHDVERARILEEHMNYMAQIEHPGFGRIRVKPRYHKEAAKWQR